MTASQQSAAALLGMARLSKVKLDVPSYLQQAWDVYGRRDVEEPKKLVAAVLEICDNTDWGKHDKVPAPPRGRTIETLQLSDVLTMDELDRLEVTDWVSDLKYPMN